MMAGIGFSALRLDKWKDLGYGRSLRPLEKTRAFGMTQPEQLMESEVRNADSGAVYLGSGECIWRLRKD
jgi:hypothetical protein